MSLYTDNPLERETHNTVPAPADVVALLKTAWLELTDNGARTLCAQFQHETGGGRFCFNWNLGNVKSGSDVPHMYLRNVWELELPERAAFNVANLPALAHIATPQECNAHGWTCPSSKVVVVYQPPHFQCRFRAYASLAEGAAKWMGNHQRIAGTLAEYLGQVNAGDCAGVAHSLKLAHYYTGDETVYALSMSAKKAQLDKELAA